MYVCQQEPCSLPTPPARSTRLNISTPSPQKTHHRRLQIVVAVVARRLAARRTTPTPTDALLFPALLALLFVVRTGIAHDLQTALGHLLLAARHGAPGTGGVLDDRHDAHLGVHVAAVFAAASG